MMQLFATFGFARHHVLAKFPIIDACGLQSRLASYPTSARSRLAIHTKMSVTAIDIVVFPSEEVMEMCRYQFQAFFSSVFLS